MAPTVLHLLAQRPGLTGSGVTLDALVRHAGAAGWRQHVVVGVPADAASPEVGGLPPEAIHPLRFGTRALPFDVPGMSDVMPYASTRYSALTPAQLAAYREGWRAHLGGVIEAVRPDVVHAHHVWLLAALVKDLDAGLPVLVHCHGTDLRQMELCPHLAAEVCRANARNERFAALHTGQVEALTRRLAIPADRIALVGAGYREDLFHPRGRHPNEPPRLLYVGKLSEAKGLPWLLDAFERLAPRHPALELHVAGSGGGDEAAALARRIEALAPRVVAHGQLEQPELAALMRRSRVLLLPSFFEGLPLVLVEARACGCRLVATDLPGVRTQIAPALGADLTLVAPPRLEGVDRPVAADLPPFVERLVVAIDQALHAPAVDVSTRGLRPFTGGAVFERVERLWRGLLRREST